LKVLKLISKKLSTKFNDPESKVFNFSLICGGATNRDLHYNFLQFFDISLYKLQQKGNYKPPLNKMKYSYHIEFGTFGLGEAEIKKCITNNNCSLRGISNLELIQRKN
jgi:hypothetical protein